MATAHYTNRKNMLSQKQKQDRQVVEPILIKEGFHGYYAGRKGHGYWMSHSNKSIGYTPIRKIKKLIKSNSLNELLKDLDKKPYTDDYRLGHVFGGRDF